jgi:hypothetical protein
MAEPGTDSTIWIDELPLSVRESAQRLELWLCANRHCRKEIHPQDFENYQDKGKEETAEFLMI